MSTETGIKKMTKKFNSCSCCGTGSFVLEIGKDRNDRAYVICTECGNNMNAETMDMLLADWNADVYKEPGSEESLADENKKLKSRNEMLVAENVELHKKLEEYEDKRLAAENRRLKTLIEELREEFDRVLQRKQSGMKHLDPDTLLNVYDRTRVSDNSRREAEYAKHSGYDARVIDCRTWDEKLA